MKILIIGGCGYIGSYLYLLLSNNGFSLDTVDLEWFGNVINKDNYVVDFKYLTDDFLKSYDIIILLAGHSSVEMCKNMLSSFNNNVVNFIHLLGKIGKQKFIYASSSSIYGQTGTCQADESQREFKPNTYYDLTKQEIDYYAQLCDVEYYGLRLGTVNGFSHNLRTDIMINKMYETAIKEKRICVYNKYSYRPILSLRDLGRAILAIISGGGDHRGIYNLASGNFSIDEIASKIAKIMGVSITDRGNTQCYDFSISTEKFKNTYKFDFTDDIESIVNDLHQNYRFSVSSIREMRKYE